jgi:hypothetical protein
MGLTFSRLFERMVRNTMLGAVWRSWADNYWGGGGAGPVHEFLRSSHTAPSNVHPAAVIVVLAGCSGSDMLGLGWGCMGVASSISFAPASTKHPAVTRVNLISVVSRSRSRSVEGNDVRETICEWRAIIILGLEGS